METCINYCTTECAYVSSDERRWITAVRKLKDRFPDDVTIIRESEQNDGCVYVSVPVRWLKIQPPKKMNLTDEQKNELRNRFMLVCEREQYR